MFKKAVTYTDFNGNEQTDDLYFNLSVKELIEMDVAANGDLQQQLQSIVDSDDVSAIYNKFKELVLAFYGVKSEDGKRFVKNTAIREEFEQSAVFDELIVELVSDSEMSAKFFKAIIDPAIAQLQERQNNKQS